MYFFFFICVFHLYGNLPYTYTPSFFPFPPPSFPYSLSLASFTSRVTPHENVTAAILSYAVSHLHEGTGKLRKTCADTVGHLRACEIPRSVSKTVNNFFHYGLHLRPKKSNTCSGDDVRIMCCYFLGRKCKP